MNNLAERPPIILSGDLERLTKLAHDLAAEFDPLGSLLLHKLARAQIRDSDQVRDARASLGSFIAYRVLGGEERRFLIHPRDSMWPPAELSVATPLGIAVLGAAAGDQVLVSGTAMQEPPCVEVLCVETDRMVGSVSRLPLGSRKQLPSLADRR